MDPRIPVVNTFIYKMCKYTQTYTRVICLWYRLKRDIMETQNHGNKIPIN